MIFPGDVAGWLTPDEAEALAALAADKTVLEIGSYEGRSTICLAQTARVVYAVDTFDGRATPTVRPTLDAFRANVARYGLSDRVVECVGTSESVVPRLGLKFDLAFIDGAHDHQSVATDCRLVRDVLKPGGIVAFHDWKIPSVRSAAAQEFGWDGPATVDSICGFYARKLEQGVYVLSIQEMDAELKALEAEYEKAVKTAHEIEGAIKSLRVLRDRAVAKVTIARERATAGESIAQSTAV